MSEKPISSSRLARRKAVWGVVTACKDPPVAAARVGKKRDYNVSMYGSLPGFALRHSRFT